MQHRHDKHLRAYLEAWSDALINDDAATPWNANTVNEELAAVEDCLSGLDQVWPQTEPSEASPSDIQFSNKLTSSGMSGSSGKIPSYFSVSQEGSLVGRFRLERKLGAGGMGVVYLAKDTVLQRFVAVKLPLQKAVGVPSLSERFQREAAAAARLRHTNIVGVLESGTDHGHDYIVSEWIDGPDLKHWFTQADQPIEVLAAAECIEQVADGVQCAHDEGILHRDLKPANILLHPRQQHQAATSLKEFIPKVTDFGLARDVRSDLELTNTGEAIGTPAYCAPEQLDGSNDSIEPHSDVFSLGTILYQLLTGTSPFRRGSWLATVQAVQDHHPLPPRSLRSDIPRDLEAVCMKCLQKQPSKRYATAAALRDDLRRFREGRATIARPLPWWEGIQRWSRSSPYRAAFLLVSALLLLTAVVGLSIHSNALHRHQAELTETLAEVDAERNRANQLLSEAQVLRRTAEDRERVARQLAFDSDMRLASSHMERNQLLSASDVLQRYSDTDDRDLTFGILNAVLSSQFRTITQHSGPAHEVAVVPDAHQVISVGEDGVLRHFDFHSGSPIAELQLDRGPQHAIDVSPDGSTIAIAENAEALQPAQIHFIDSASGEIKNSIPITRSTVESLRWNANGRMLAIGSRYADVHLWNSQT
ncbi:MAG: protein kinase, partial [Planctomycetaceae bacterium]|nr:protein kinase [Planctomycetaceae bacterium]